jgi:predicted DNA-binding transcriptional regulator YafY
MHLKLLIGYNPPYSKKGEEKMYHPTTRVLTILEILQARGSLSGAELARRLEVDRRTVRRYITMLQDLGIPIEGTRGLAGGYRLRAGYKLPPLMLTDDEALGILLSLIAARRQGIPADPHTIEGALAKIERVLPEGLRRRFHAVQSSVAFLAGKATPQPPGEMVMLLSMAVSQQRRVLLRYRSYREETERGVDPYGLVLHWNHWYLVGWCHLRQSIRVFRLDRILDAVTQESTFTRPDPFDCLEYLLHSFATAQWGHSVEVLLETTMAHARRCIPAGSALFEQTEKGVVIRSHTERLDEVARILLFLACPFVIRRPAELRDALRAVAAEAAAMAERQE